MNDKTSDKIAGITGEMIAKTDGTSGGTEIAFLIGGDTVKKTEVALLLLVLLLNLIAIVLLCWLDLCRN